VGKSPQRITYKAAPVLPIFRFGNENLKVRARQAESKSDSIRGRW
jgi:hypothetical protein